MSAHIYADDIAQTDFISGTSAYSEVRSLIEKGLYKNKNAIHLKAQSLTDNEVSKLTQQYKLTSPTPLFLNSVVGFGSGSFMIGDMVGGSIHAALDIIAAGAAIGSSGYLFFIMQKTDQSFADRIETINTTMYVMYAAMTLYVVNRIASIISVVVYTRKYNRTLDEVLQKDDTAVSWTTFPIIAPQGIGLGVTMRY